MLQDVLLYLSWSVITLLVFYLGVRIGTTAYYRSKREHYNQLKKEDK